MERNKTRKEVRESEERCECTCGDQRRSVDKAHLNTDLKKTKQEPFK